MLRNSDLVRATFARSSRLPTMNKSTEKATQPTVATLNHKRPPSSRPVASFAASASVSDYTLCENERHSLYVCPRFKSLPRDKMISTIREKELCMNCLRPRHFSKRCKSINKCRKCRNHTILSYTQTRKKVRIKPLLPRR